MSGERRSDRQVNDEPSLGMSIGLLCVVLFAMFAIVGNVRVAGMTLRNGCAATGSYTIGKDALRAEYVDGLLVEGRSH